MPRLTHFDDTGRSKMVDITKKDITRREAVATGIISMKPETFEMITKGKVKKGNVLEVSKIAGIMAAKRTSDLIPMSHPIDVTSVDILFHPDPLRSRIKVESKVRVVSRTGVEMEALIAVSIAALTVYDMCKSMDREMVISDIRLIEKQGGKSGKYKLGATTRREG
ncbi:MAG: cyclic pyranopterin monophosphate synthase MoaC [Thermodesulfobacteriota bacterium]|nr:cyclic pyranopterin monophosphate synthase MoaC [Thermodesulfobacteriota bacterium]